jgi:hypothetical protein
MDLEDLPHEDELPEPLKRDLADTREILKQLADDSAVQQAKDELTRISSEAISNAFKTQDIHKQIFQLDAGLRERIEQMYRIEMPETDSLMRNLEESLAGVHREQAEREARRDAAADAAVETAEAVAALASAALDQNTQLRAIIGVLQELVQHADSEAKARLASEKTAKKRHRWNSTWTIVGVGAAIVAAVVGVILL